MSLLGPTQTTCGAGNPRFHKCFPRRTEMHCPLLTQCSKRRCVRGPAKRMVLQYLKFGAAQFKKLGLLYFLRIKIQETAKPRLLCCEPGLKGHVTDAL